jgi:hypothetical protein
VSYATALDPSAYITLSTILRFDVTEFPLREDYDWETNETIMIPDEDMATTLVQLTSMNGILAEQVVSLRFIFNGIENGGTAYREFQVLGAPSPVPLPATGWLLLSGLTTLFGIRWFRSKAA